MKKRVFEALILAVFACLLVFSLPDAVHAEERYCYECEEVTMFCEYCGDKCVVCHTGCDSCWACDDCIKLCEYCNDVCVVCNLGCDGCWSCEDCLQLCTVCDNVCAVCNTGCDNCWICEECIVVCQNCDACLGCNEDGCSNNCEQLCHDCCAENDACCVICRQCLLCSPIKCEDCGFCVECAPECQACDACLECGGDGCANECGVLCVDCVEGNEGAACAECGQCVFCITLACEDCNLCEDCLVGEYACPICEECTNCRSDEVCENCGVCWNCAPICISCESACKECSVLCEDCGEYCEDCAEICPDCNVCENCAQLCVECGRCENCAELCADCGACEECVTLCEGCNELCRDCASAWCDDCNTCDDCVSICDDCGAICEECADSWCHECHTCSNCEVICNKCGELCEGCAFEWCAVCDTCEECAVICSGCGAICEDCATAFCPSCDSCSNCEIICEECGECGSCCGCEGGSDTDSGSDENHKHNTTKVSGFDPTCTEDGQRTYYTCDCGLWFEDAAATRQITSKKSVIIPASHDYGKLIEGKAPVHTADCLEAGMKPHYICADCGNYFTANKKETDIDSLTIPAPEHTYSDTWEYKGADGHGKACSCGNVDGIQPHVPGEEATDTTPQLCRVCGYVIQPAKNHIHKFSLIPSKAATCTTKGQKEYYTCDCGKCFEDPEGKTEITLLASIVIPAGHQYGSLVLATPATHTLDGSIQPGIKEHYVCQDCGAYFDANKQKRDEDQLTIDKTEHRFYDGNGDGKCDDCEKILEEIAKQNNENGGNSGQAGIFNGIGKNGMPWWVTVLLALVSTGGGILVALLLLKIKNKNKEKSPDDQGTEQETQ